MKTGLKWGKFSAHFPHQHRSGLSWAPGSGLWSSLGHSKWGILVSKLYQSSGARGTSACIEDVLLSLTKRVAGSQPQNVSVLCWEHVQPVFCGCQRGHWHFCFSQEINNTLKHYSSHRYIVWWILIKPQNWLQTMSLLPCQIEKGRLSWHQLLQRLWNAGQACRASSTISTEHSLSLLPSLGCLHAKTHGHINVYNWAMCPLEAVLTFL